MKKLVPFVLIPMLILSSIFQAAYASDIPWGDTQTVDCMAVADTYVSAKSGETNNNFGSSEEFDVSGVSTAKNYAYLVIDASDWQIARLDSAKLRLFGLSVVRSNLNVYRIDNKIWDQKSITYTSRPSDAGKTLIGTMAIGASSYTWYELDLTQALANEPDKILSLCIETTDARIVKFASTENSDKTLAPRITITGAKPNGEILVESISLDKTSMSLISGLDRGSTLKASIIPAFATNREVKWTSSDESVAMVDGLGYVEPVNVGTAYITASSATDLTIYAQCKVNVVSPEEAGVYCSTKITSDDCYVTPSWPGNHGGESLLPMRCVKNNQIRQIYTKFQFPDIAGYEILSAKVYMYCVDSQSDPLGLPVTPYGIFGNDTWSEKTVTEASAKRPETQADITPAPIMNPYTNSTTRIYDPSSWYSWDVTQYAQEKGNGIYSLKFSIDDYGTLPYNNVYLDSISFSSKEGRYAPYMEIVARPYGIKNNAGITTVSSKLTNSGQQIMPAVLMAVNYDANGNMENVAADQYNIDPSLSHDYSVIIPEHMDQIGGYTKFLLWEDVKTALPLKIAQKYYEGGPEYIPPTHSQINGISIDGNRLTIKGKTIENANVGYALFKPGAYEADLDYQNLQGCIAQIDQKGSDDDGNFEFTYNIPSGLDEGVYTAMVSDQNTVGLILPKTFKYIRPENLTDSRLRQELTNATTPLELQEILYPYAIKLGISTSKLFTKYFSNLDDNTKNKLLNTMLDNFDTNTTDSSAKIINDTIGLYLIARTENYTEMSEILSDCMAELGIPNDIGNMLRGNQTLLGRVSQQLYGKTFTSIEDFSAEVERILDENANTLALPNIFMDNMVLQAGKSINVWGYAVYNRTVTATLTNGTDTYTTTAKADSNNNFKTTFSQVIPASYTPYTLTVTDGTIIKTFKNILFGDVYLLAGETNMAMTMNDFYNCSSDPEKKQEIQNDIDTSNNNYIRFISSLSDCATTPQQDVFLNKPWQSVSPQSVGNTSAIGYYFAKEIQQSENIPIGIISAAAENSTSFAWMENGSLYNNHIYPFRNCNLKGVIWYQGAYDSDSLNYDTRCISIIDNYRILFNDKNLPFCTIGLTNDINADIQNLQVKTFQHYEDIAGTISQNTVGYVSTVDLSKNYLYNNTIGIRVAKWSKSVIYGEGGEYCGPIVQNVWNNYGLITVLFDHVGEGLTLVNNSQTVELLVWTDEGNVYEVPASITGKNKLTTINEIPNLEKPIKIGYDENSLIPNNSNIMNSDGYTVVPFTESIESKAITDIILSDNNGNNITNLVPGGKINAVSISNYNRQAGKVIVGIYQEGKLVALSVKAVNSYNFTSYGEAIINIDLDIPSNINPDKAVIKALYIDNLNTASPLTKAYKQK